VALTDASDVPDVPHVPDMPTSDEQRDARNDPPGETFAGSRRALLVVGTLLALAGMAVCLGWLFSAFVDRGSSKAPSDTEIAGTPVLALGFGLLAVGLVIAGVGSGLSRWARPRRR
jgi:hypothetical protein